MYRDLPSKWTKQDKLRSLEIGKKEPTCLEGCERHTTVVELTQLRATDVKAVHEASVIRQQRNKTFFEGMKT